MKNELKEAAAYAKDGFKQFTAGAAGAAMWFQSMGKVDQTSEDEATPAGAQVPNGNVPAQQSAAAGAGTADLLNFNAA